MEDAKRDHFMIKGLTEHSVTSIKEIFDRLKKGELNRHYAATFMNHSSSRSHTLFRITVKAVTNNFIRNYRQENKGKSNLNLHHFLHQDSDNENHGTVVTESYLNFVDLAGSERIRSHIKNAEDDYDDDEKEKQKANQDSRVKEGKAINKSLFYLTRVISILAEGNKNLHIPFRNSPLTKILRSSLGGNFRTLVVLCVNPCLSQIEISLSTMRFGVNAKKIQNAIKANILTNNNDESIKILIEQYERKLRDIQNQRDEDNTRYVHYINVIDELRLQRSLLLERLEEANKKLSVHIVSSLPENDLFKFFRQAQTKTAVMPQTGLLFVPKSQTKYDDIDDLEGETNKVNKFKKKFEEEMRCTTKDFVNKFALQAYNKVKADFESIKKKVTDHQNYLTQLCGSFKTVTEFVANLSSLGEAYLQKLQVMSEQYEDEYILANERQLKLDLYEKFKGFTLLSDKDLEKMKNYLLDFRESVKSEMDRRELLASSTANLPKDALDALQELFNNEKESQENKLKTLKRKIEDFVSFREGCKAEIDYYHQLNEDFRAKSDIDTKAREIEDFISNQMAEIANKVQKMDAKFLEYDNKLKESEKQTLDKTVKAMKSKFDKLIDMVLLNGKTPKPKEEKIEEYSSKESPDHSFSTSPNKQSLFRKSRTINLEDDSKSTKGEEKKPGPQESKVKTWMTLNKLENYGSMIKDDESVMRSIYGGAAAFMVGHNLATINENVSNDDNISDKTFSMKNGRVESAFLRDKTPIGKPFTTKELPDRNPQERSSYAAGGNTHKEARRDRMMERKSHVVGRSGVSPFAHEVKTSAEKFNQKVTPLTRLKHLAGEDKLKAASQKGSPRKGRNIFGSNSELRNDHNSSSNNSEDEADENSRPKLQRNLSSSKNFDSQSIDKSSPRGKKNKALALDLKKSHPVVPQLDYMSPNSLLTNAQKSSELSHRVMGNIDKERISYKSQNNGRDAGPDDLMGEDAISVENMEIIMNSHQGSKQNTKGTLSKGRDKEAAKDKDGGSTSLHHKKETSVISSPNEHFCSESDLGAVKNFEIEINQGIFDDKKSSITSTPLKQPTKSTTANGKKATPSSETTSIKKLSKQNSKGYSGGLFSNIENDKKPPFEKKNTSTTKASKNDKASERQSDSKSKAQPQQNGNYTELMTEKSPKQDSQKQKEARISTSSKTKKKPDDDNLVDPKPSKISEVKEVKIAAEEPKKTAGEKSKTAVASFNVDTIDSKKSGRPVTASAPKQAKQTQGTPQSTKENPRPASQAKPKKDSSTTIVTGSPVLENIAKSEEKPRITASSLSKSFVKASEPSTLFKSSPESKGIRSSTKK